METRRKPKKGARPQPQVPSFRPPLRAGTSQVRCGPDPRKRDTVLAAVKDASRRLRRWPKRAILDCGGARGHWANAGRDEETAPRSNKETGQEKANPLAPSSPIAPGGHLVAPKLHARNLPSNSRYHHQTCRVSSRSKMSTISPVEHPQAQTPGEAPSPAPTLPSPARGGA